MHEYSIVSALLEQCDKYASAHDADVDVVVVGVGVCSAIEPKLLQSAFETFKEESEHTRSATLQIEIQPIVLQCGACGAQSEIEDTRYGACPKCQSPSVQIIQGRDMLLLRLEMLESKSQHTPSKTPSATP